MAWQPFDSGRGAGTCRRCVRPDLGSVSAMYQSSPHGSDRCVIGRFGATPVDLDRGRRHGRTLISQTPSVRIWEQEVGGSNPPSPTRSTRTFPDLGLTRTASFRPDASDKHQNPALIDARSQDRARRQPEPWSRPPTNGLRDRCVATDRVTRALASMDLAATSVARARRRPRACFRWGRKAARSGRGRSSPMRATVCFHRSLKMGITLDQRYDRLPEH